MYFTKGQLHGYERMMQEKPGHDRRPTKTMKERDCKQCRYLDKHSGKCSKEKCVLTDD